MSRTASFQPNASHGAHWPEWLSVLLLLALLALRPGAGLAAAAPQAAGLDIVIAIDQSGSMSKADGATVANDPGGKRVKFLELLLPVLREEARNGYTTRMSVVEFGSRDAANPFKRPQTTLKGQTILPVAPGRDGNMAEQEWKAALSRIKAVSRGNTDHPRALALVEEELHGFAENPPPPPIGGKTGPRSPIVLLVTDGKPYVDKLTPESQLLDEAAAVARRFPQGAGGIRFGVVGLGDGESKYWHINCQWQGQQGCGRFWQDLATKDENGAGLAFLAKTYEELIPRLYETFGELVQRPIACGQDKQTVPPYLRGLHVQVDFLKIGLPLSALDIRDAQSRPVLPAAGERPSSTGLAFAVAYPQPGQWQLSKPNSPYRVCLDYELEEAQLIGPASPAAQGKAAPIRYRLGGRGPNGWFEALPEFPLRFTVAVQTPGGKQSSLDLRPDPDPAHPGEIVTEPYPFEETGEYRLRLSGEIAAVGLPQGRATVYASKEAGGDAVRVEPGTPVRIRVELPKPGETVALRLGHATLPVKLSFFNTQNNAALPPGTVLKPGTALAVQWLAEGQDAAEAMAFTAATPDGDRLKAELTMDLGGGWLRHLIFPGQFRLYIQSAEFAQGMVAQGVEGGGDWQSAAYEFRESRWTLGLGLLGMATALGLLGWGGWRWFNNWRFRKQDRTEKLKPVLRLQFPTDDSFNYDWNVLPNRLTRPATAKVPLPDQTEWLIEDFSIRRRFAAGAVSIQVCYRPKSREEGKRLRIEKIDLKTSNNGLVTADSTRRVKGLESFQANFVLLIEKNPGW